MKLRTLALLVLTSGLVFSQNDKPIPNSFSFENVSMEEGLSYSCVSSIYQDRRGYMWFATSDGLNRFDGKNFRYIRAVPHNKDTSPSNWFTCVLQADDGSFWVGTNDSGLHMIDPNSGLLIRDRFHWQDESNAPSQILDLFKDHSGRIWVAGEKGVFYKEPTDNRFVQLVLISEGNEGTQKTNCFFQDRMNNLWIGSDRGLFLLPNADPLQQPQIVTDGNQPLDHVLSITHLDEESLYVGTKSSLMIVDIAKASTRGRVSLLDGMLVFSCLVDRGGNHWIGTDRGLFCKSEKWKSWQHYEHNPHRAESLADNHVLDLYEDRTGLIWAATWGGGVSKINLKKEQFENYGGYDSPLGDLGVVSLHSDQQQLWAASNEKLVKVDFQNNQFSTYQAEDVGSNMPIENYTTILKDKTGKLWLGTWNGLYQSQTDKGPLNFSPVPTENGEPLPIWVVTEGRENTLWVGTGQGLYQADQTHPSPTLTPLWPGDNEKSINSIYEDALGILWIGTVTHGLIRYDPITGNSTTYQYTRGQTNSLSHNSVSGVVEMPSGTLWIATLGGGLNRIILGNDRILATRYDLYAEDDGLPTNAVTSILKDDQGYLWLGTTRGLAKFDPSQGRFIAFTESDGLTESDFNQAATVGAQGDLYFGTVEGFVHFDPKKIEVSNYEPPMYFTDISPLSPELSPEETQKITLTHRQPQISLRFAALDYHAPEKVQYRYQLEGVQESWTNLGNKNELQFTSLNPDSYNLIVQASNSDGIWSDSSKIRLIMDVRPHPLRSQWAYAAYFLLFILVLAAAYQRKIVAHREMLIRKERELAGERKLAEGLKQTNQLKDQILANTSHELRTPLHGMIGLAESMVDGAGGPLSREQAENLGMIVSSGRRLSKLVDDILNFSKLVNREETLHLATLDLHMVVELVLRLLRPSMGNKNLELINDVPTDLPYLQADEDKLVQVLMNLLGNAVKFTNEGQVRVTAEADNTRIWISVSDTGIGIPKEAHQRIFESFEQVDGSSVRAYSGTGLGLAITKNLIELHGGRITVDSEPDRGSTFRFDMPRAGADADAPQQSGPRQPRPTGYEETTGLEMHTTFTSGENEDSPSPYSAHIDGGQYQILVVDDEHVNRRVIGNFLSVHSYNLQTAENGEQALEIIFSDDPPDLILLDVMMPNLSGYDVCRKVREHFGPEELPIILLTAKDQEADVVEGFQAGANDYLRKPTGKMELVSRINLHLELTQTRRQLERSHQKLKEANTLLEQRVADRTRDLQMSNQELKTLDEIVKVINREVGLKNLLDTILKQGMNLFPKAERGAFLMLDPRRNDFEIVATAGFQEISHEDVHLTMDNINQRYIKNADTETDGVYVVAGRDKTRGVLEQAEPPLATMTMPMLVGSHMEGFIILENTGDEAAFSGSEARQMERLRAHIVSALNKAKLVRDLIDKNNEILRTQKQMITQEKLASLGALTAGIAHEIRNPLNFINNFAAISVDMFGELDEFLTEKLFREQERPEEMGHLISDLEENAKLIKHHGERAEGIVRRMLDHSQSQVGDRTPTDLNALVEEFVDFGYYGVRARFPDLTIRVEKDFDEKVGMVELVPQDISRVVLNMVENGCYAARKRALENQEEDYVPKLSVITKALDRKVQIIIRDNGKGIPPQVVDKIFIPFYTTKPAGEGTGLGLSISYEIVVQGHHGSLTVDSKENDFTEFVITLPYQ